MKHPREILVIFFLLFLFAPLAAQEAQEASGQATEIMHQMTEVVLQLAVILAATWLGGKAAQRIKLPAVIGQIIAGMIVGPFALGGIAIPGFPGGLFPAVAGAIPVTPMIYTMATIASIILLFLSGLETDLGLFLRYIGKGGIVGISGVVFSFFSGALMICLFFDVGFGDPLALFMGSLSVATSVGITASILSQKRKVDSPEGTVILSAAVIDDVLGIIILAVVIGFASLSDSGGIQPLAVVWIAVRAILIWAVATFIGVKFARPIGRFLKTTFRDKTILSIMALGLALFLSGLFEKAGLSMIIGAYIMGLTLSNTDLAYVIQEKLKPLHDLFVPIFFAVSGMMVNFTSLASWEVIGFGLLFTVVAVAAKVIGAGAPAAFLGFTYTGAMRIGWGMVPRGEVALIIASIGVASGILNETFFGVALLMTLLTTMIAPPILNAYLSSKKKGQRTTEAQTQKTETIVKFQTPEFAELIIPRFLNEMEKEGFFISRIEHHEQIYQLRKDDVFITLSIDANADARFISNESDVGLFQTALYESLLQISESAADLKTKFKPKEMAAAASSAVSTAATTAKKPSFDMTPYLFPSLVRLELRGTNKESIIEELIEVCAEHIVDVEEATADVLERERSMSTGMQNGIAIPHAKTNGVEKMIVAIGIKKEGVDFQSLDGKPSTIFFLILSPKQGYGPHLQLLASLTGAASKPEVRSALLDAQTGFEVLRTLGV